MFISHEIPICLFKDSQKFNDYEYCLLHLLLENKDYREFYINQSKKGRKCILDNSLFELGDSLDINKLIEGIELIKPSEFIIPDCLNNCEETINRFENYLKHYKNVIESISPLSNNIGVVQGDSLDSLVKCYKYMSLNAYKIAIPFDSKGFNDLFTQEELYSLNKLEIWCYGRQKFIKYLYDNDIFNNNKPHHLLGCSLAKEFSYKLYKELFIESVDTSNPVIAGINYSLYNNEGISTKSSIKLCDLINYEINTYQRDIILYNVYKFKEICNGYNWISFFSQTGTEIYDISNNLYIAPSLIITNKSSFKNINEYLYNNYQDRIIKTPFNPSLNDYKYILEQNDYCFNNKTLWTLNGYLRIMPKEICERYNIYNLHPGLINEYPELKGFNPQEKAYKLKLPVSGCAIHEVVPEVDSGEIVSFCKVNIENMSLEQIYKVLHDEALKLWLKWFKENEY